MLGVGFFRDGGGGGFCEFVVWWVMFGLMVVAVGYFWVIWWIGLVSVGLFGLVVVAMGCVDNLVGCGFYMWW